MAKRSHRKTQGQGWELIRARQEEAQRAPKRLRSEPPGEQKVSVREERRGGGKVVTVARGFRLSQADLEALGKRLKSTCGAGGTTGDDLLEVQGHQRDKVAAALEAEGFRVQAR